MEVETLLEEGEQDESPDRGAGIDSDGDLIKGCGADLEGYKDNDDEVEGPAKEVNQLKQAKKRKGILTTIIPTTPLSSDFPFINSPAHNLLE